MVFDREAETGARAALRPRLRDLKSGGWLLDSQVRLQGLGEGQRRYLHKQLYNLGASGLASSVEQQKKRKEEP